jgi:hypothetical protein
MNGTAMQFVRVISCGEDMEIWNANRNGFSFVISYETAAVLAFRDALVSWRRGARSIRTDAPLGSAARPLNPSLRPKKPARPCWDTSWDSCCCARQPKPSGALSCTSAQKWIASIARTFSCPPWGFVIACLDRAADACRDSRL